MHSQRIITAAAFNANLGKMSYTVNADSIDALATDIREHVNSLLRMHGMHLVDASIMMILMGGNTHSPTIMLIEKTANMLRSTH